MPQPFVTQSHRVGRDNLQWHIWVKHHLKLCVVVFTLLPLAVKLRLHQRRSLADADAVHGFIAQEMEEIVPEAVSKGDNEDDMWSMDYGRITPVLVAALQDAHKKIEELAAEVAK